MAQCITSPRCRAWLLRRAIRFYSIYNSSLVQLSFASLNSASRSFISCEIPGHRTALRETFVYCTTPSKLVVYTPMGAQRAESRYCCTVASAVSYHSQQCVWCHNNFVLHSADLCAILSRTEIVLWMKYAMVARWLYLATRGKKGWNLTYSRYEILINRIQFSKHSRCCTTQMANGMMRAMVRYFAFGERSTFYSTRLRLVE